MELQNGVDVKTLSTMPGHYDAGFALRTYTHATRQKRDEAAYMTSDAKLHETQQERRILHPALLRRFQPFPTVGQVVGLDRSSQKKASAESASGKN